MPDESKTCPACGAFMNRYDTACPICGAAVEEVLGDDIGDVNLRGAMDEVECASCGAFVSMGTGNCSVCGEDIGLSLGDVDAELDAVGTPEEEHRECPECGALQENGSDKCFLCDADMPVIENSIDLTTDKADVPVMEDEFEEPVNEEVLPTDEIEATEDVVGQEPSEGSHIECPECGASLDADATECFLCDAAIIEIGQSPEIPLEDDVPPEEPEPIIEEETVIEEVVEESEVLSEEADTELPPDAESLEDENGFEIAAPEDLPDDVEEVVDDIIEEEVPQLAEDEVFCPSCSNVIKRDVEKCTECWADLSLYATCEACGGYLRVDANTCPNCFATLMTDEPVEETPEVEFEQLDVLMDIDIEEAEVSQALEMEMTALEEADENDKECLVCGAHFLSQDDEFCPICGLEYGVEIDEWVEPDKVWDGFEVLVPPTTFICPNCNEKVVGLEKSSREINEEKWFYRGIITIFIGIFFTTFSVWLRGMALESQAVGVRPPPFDVAVSLAGWILVLMGFAFWFISYRISQELIECPQCSVEVTEDMTHCINCNLQLAEDDELPAPNEKTSDKEMSFLPEDADMEAFSQHVLEAEEQADEIVEDVDIEGLTLGDEIEISEDDDLEVIEEDLGLEVEEELEEPEELLEPDLDTPAELIDEPLTIDEPVEETELEADIEEPEPMSSEPITEDDLAAPFEVDDPMEEPEVEIPGEGVLEEPVEEPAELIDELEPDAREDMIESEAPVAVAVSDVMAEPEAEEEHRECPECGALQENGSEKCFLCGAHIETALEGAEEALIEPGMDISPPPTSDSEIAPDEEHIECAGCGASLEADSTECFLCGETVSIVSEPDIPEIPEEADDLGTELPTEHEEHKKCPGCGIFVDEGTIECPVCDTVFDGAVSPIEEDVEIPIIEAEPETETPAGEVHIDCPECGASLEADSEECFLCGADIGTTRGLPEPESDVASEDEEKKECPSCGAIVDPLDTHCSICDEHLVD